MGFPSSDHVLLSVDHRAAAIEVARQRLDGLAIEVWNDSRLVKRLEPEQGWAALTGLLWSKEPVNGHSLIVCPKTYTPGSEMTGNEYRVKAEELRVQLAIEANPSVRAEIENIARSYLRLAEHADRKAMTAQNVAAIMTGAVEEKPPAD